MNIIFFFTGSMGLLYNQIPILIDHKHQVNLGTVYHMSFLLFCWVHDGSMCHILRLKSESTGTDPRQKNNLECLEDLKNST